MLERLIELVGGVPSTWIDCDAFASWLPTLSVL
jgi:hypothetical protein